MGDTVLFLFLSLKHPEGISYRMVKCIIHLSTNLRNMFAYLALFLLATNRLAQDPCLLATNRLAQDPFPLATILQVLGLFPLATNRLAQGLFPLAKNRQALAPFPALLKSIHSYSTFLIIYIFASEYGRNSNVSNLLMSLFTHLGLSPLANFHLALVLFPLATNHLAQDPYLLATILLVLVPYPALL